MVGASFWSILSVSGLFEKVRLAFPLSPAFTLGDIPL
jgi:hypothetical protein